jgi:L,D-transpeptidase catalytic domain
MSDRPLTARPAPLDPEAASPDAVVAGWHRFTMPRRVAALLAALAIAGSAAGVWIAAARFAPLPLPVASDTTQSAAAARLRRQLERLGPSGYYVVVDTFRNRLRIYRGGELVRDAVCSSGSGLVLKDEPGGRQWTFDTPRGERQVIRKTRNPVWVKPDWAYIEEGFLPPASFAERRDDVSLGDYGLYLGDGYIIHGTLFKSLLGRRVTHGCIRLGDEDLEFAYQKLPLGARVYLY